jgi:hypothetical protein
LSQPCLLEAERLDIYEYAAYIQVTMGF